MTSPETIFACGTIDSARPGPIFPRRDFDLVTWADTLGVGVPIRADVVPAGACSTHIALLQTAEILQAGRATAAIVGAADSQLNLPAVRWHEDNYRLKCPYLTDGLMPGEAACFLVVEPEELARHRGAHIIARILSVAAAVEHATILSDAPNTASALTTAARHALEDADVSPLDIGLILSDLNGESYRAREWAFAELRLGFQTNTALMHPADCHGDLGTATDANLLGLASMCHGTGWSDGKPILVFAGSEGGYRTASVIAPPEQPAPFLQVSKRIPRVFSTEFRVPEPTEPLDDFGDAGDPPRAYFEWQLREEHRDEIASLFYQRTAILHDPEVEWRRLGRHEQRMLNHLDAAVASGPSSMAVVAAGIDAEEEGLCFAGALLIGTLPTRHNFESIVRSLEVPTAARIAGIGAGLVHAPDSEPLRAIVRDLLDASETAVQTMAITVAASRRMDVRDHLLRTLAMTTDGNLLKAAAEACGRLRVDEAARLLQALLSNERSDVRKAVILALLRLLPGPTAAYARSSIAFNDRFDGALALCLGVAGQLSDAPILLEHIARHPRDADATVALGILGAPGCVPHLLALLEHEEDTVKVAAATALEVMSGLHARERTTRIEPSAFDGDFETRDVDQVSTSREVWSRWWNSQRTRVNPNMRWRRSEHFALGSCIDELADPKATYEARSRAYLELATRAPVEIPFEPDWFVARQDEAISAWHAWWADHNLR
jgi:hypothetical protein